MRNRRAGIMHFKKCIIVVATFCYTNIFLSLVYYHDFESSYIPVNSTGTERKYEFIPECHCNRQKYYVEEGPKRLNSSCSDPGTFFQSSQKVVSFSLYLPKNTSRDFKLFYLEGIVENLKAMRLYYPGYTMRLYTDVKLDQEFCHILCNNPEFFWCDIRKSPSHRNLSEVFFMIWRFVPLGDPTVDHFLSRDLDSIVSEREAAVVSDWLKLPEKKGIHIMRDKINAHNVAILGGTWGASNSLLRGTGNQNAVSILPSILKAGLNGSSKGFDQDVLYFKLFDPLKDEIVAYDSYHCEYWRNYTLVRPFPIQRKNKWTDFVGIPSLGRVKYNLKKCPLECRPEYGRDWEWC